MKKDKRARDVQTGRFITKEEAKKRPNTTVVETIKKPKSNKKR